jgi:hypothetical protein
MNPFVTAGRAVRTCCPSLPAAECRRKDVDVLLAPTVSLQRSPFGGRNFEPGDFRLHIGRSSRYVPLSVTVRC